jgi:hypothetical protein
VVVSKDTFLSRLKLRSASTAAGGTHKAASAAAGASFGKVFTKLRQSATTFGFMQLPSHLLLAVSLLLFMYIKY